MYKGVRLSAFENPHIIKKDTQFLKKHIYFYRNIDVRIIVGIECTNEIVGVC